MPIPEHVLKGLSPTQALDTLLEHYERNPKPWVPPSWREPRQAILRTLLSNPITEEQAQALETVSADLNELQAMIDWLSNHADEPWREYWKQVQQEREEDRRRARAEAKKRRIKLLVEAKKRRIDELKEGTPLRLAASVGQVEQVVSLIQEGAEVNAVDRAGRSPIYEAALGGHAKVVEILLSKGASARGARFPPLHGAAYCGQVEVATMLLVQGAPINGRDRDGTTALHQAAMGGQAGMISLLAHHGADLTAESDYGTPMAVAVHWNRPESVHALAALGVPIDPIGQLRIPRHFFISFSQKNRRIAADLGKELEDRSVPVWIASDDLIPGKPDWEAAVREAIEESFAVLLLASRDSRESLYVRGELKVAETKAIKVIPLWIEGDKWVDSVPLDMTYGQYIDFREPSRSEGLKSLVPVLLSLIDEATPPHFRVMPFWRVNRSNPRPGSARTTGSTESWFSTRVQAPRGSLSIALTAEPEWRKDGGIGAFFNVAKYTCVHAFLDDLYTNYLRRRFKPFSYGKEWILEEEVVRWSEYRHILAPWSAVVGPTARASERDEDWLLHTSLPDTGLEPGSLWSVTESIPTCIAGVAVKDKRIFRVLQRGGKEAHFLRDDGILTTVPVSDLGDRMPFRYVVGLDQTNASQEPCLIIQTDRTISEDRLTYFDRN
jgi:hypothetical protein